MLEHVLLGLLLLAAIVCGAIVVLLVNRSSLESSRSREAHSLELLKLAVGILTNQEAETARARAMEDLTRTVKKLDTTVGNLFVQTQIRSRARQDAQTGEVPPGTAAGPVLTPPWMQHPPLTTKPGLQPEDTTDQSVGERERDRAFGQPT